MAWGSKLLASSMRTVRRRSARTHPKAFNYTGAPQARMAPPARVAGLPPRLRERKVGRVMGLLRGSHRARGRRRTGRRVRGIARRTRVGRVGLVNDPSWRAHRNLVALGVHALRVRAIVALLQPVG